MSSSSPLVNPMGLTTEPLNVIVLLPALPHALAIASRKLPALVSAFVVTTGFAVQALFTCTTVLLVLGS